MSYAQAASSGKSSSSSASSSKGPQQGRYFNEKMVVCMASGFRYEKLAEVINKCVVSGFQKVNFNQRYALVIEDGKVRNRLVISGLNIDGKHVMFSYHKRRERPRVYVSQLPTGISELEIRQVFSFYGNILGVQAITKVLHGQKIDTGDRVLIYENIDMPIPSCVFVGG